MPLSSLSPYLDMGGYGTYVWPAYGLALVALLILAVLSVKGAKKSEQELVQIRMSLKEDAS